WLRSPGRGPSENRRVDPSGVAAASGCCSGSLGGGGMTGCGVGGAGAGGAWGGAVGGVVAFVADSPSFSLDPLDDPSMSPPPPPPPDPPRPKQTRAPFSMHLAPPLAIAYPPPASNAKRSGPNPPGVSPTMPPAAPCLPRRPPRASRTTSPAPTMPSIPIRMVFLPLDERHDGAEDDDG